ncbi:MAG TPA: hypothetical protein VMS32_02130 [Verrucomicrobiae bacterium]|nr:hypothetical protein [Verrucomicrobiae bacterium]
MLDVTQAKNRRRFYLERGLRKQPIGAGSDLVFLMALPRTKLPMKPEELFGDLPAMIVGGVATRAYAPERVTKDIDLMVEHDRFVEAIQRLRVERFEKKNDLFFPNASLGLYGESWTKENLEIDILSSPQEWCKLAFRIRVDDQTGARVIPLPYLVLMKFDSARGIDQGDLTRMLGPLDDEKIEQIIKVVERHSGDPTFANDVRQYAQLGRWEWETKQNRHQGKDG